jgi:putative ABC transport system substrate-binding protein
VERKPIVRTTTGATTSFVDKILKGTKPAEIPIEQPTKFELMIIKTAKALRLTIPPLVMMRANEVIK